MFGGADLSSIPWTILGAVKTILVDIVPTVKIRKRPFHNTDFGDPLPMLCLSLGAEEVSEQNMAGKVWMDWPVQVVYFQAKNSTIEDPAQFQLQLDTRESIRLALSKPKLEGAVTVTNYRYDASPPFDLSGLDQHFDISCQLFTFRSTEPRSS